MVDVHVTCVLAASCALVPYPSPRYRLDKSRPGSISFLTAYFKPAVNEPSLGRQVPRYSHVR
jgi:hypothetical protein